MGNGIHSVTVLVPNCRAAKDHTFDAKPIDDSENAPSLPVDMPVAFDCDIGNRRVQLYFYYDEIGKKGCDGCTYNCPIVRSTSYRR